MTDRIENLETEVRLLTLTVRDLDRRLAALESRPPAAEKEGKGEARPAGPVPAAAAPGTAAPADRTDAVGTMALAGRVLIVVGGAYLLRALTESDVLSPTLGISLGLAYALFWGAVADRAAGRKQWWSGAAYGAAAVVTAYPLIWEAATHFRILAPPWDAALLALLTVILLVIAFRRRFQALAWMSTVAAVATAVSLIAASGAVVPCAVFLIALGIATLWLGYELEWRGLRWPVAFAADLAVVGLTVRALAPEPRDSPFAAIAVQLLLLIAYLATIVMRTMVRARNVIPFEVVQMVACFVVGFAGAVYTTEATGYGSRFLGIAGLGLGLACYAAAFAFVDRRQGRGRNFYFYTSLALLFTLTGSGLLLRGPALGLAWTLVAVSSAWFGCRLSRLALLIHSAVAVIAGALATGLAAWVFVEFVGSPEAAGSFPSTAAFILLAGAAFCAVLPPPERVAAGVFWVRVLRLPIVVTVLAGAGGCLISGLASIWGAQSAGGVDPGILATYRTIVMSLAAILLAWMGRMHRWVEWGWLVYPLLGITALKMLLQDLPLSRPATLFIALAAFGFALIFSPRLRGKAAGND